MKREQFAAFVAKTLEDVILLAEQKAGKKLPRKFAFQWLLGRSSSRVTENIVEHIVQRVFVDEEHIYPCVDIGVGDLLEDGSLLIVGSVAGYAACPFGKNWTDREGPFVHVVGQRFLDKIAGKQVRPSEAFGYVIPDMKNLPRRSQSSQSLSILGSMPGGRRFYPPRSWSTLLLEVMLVVLLAVLAGALLSQLHWLR